MGGFQSSLKRGGCASRKTSADDSHLRTESLPVWARGIRKETHVENNNRQSVMPNSQYSRGELVVDDAMAWDTVTYSNDWTTSTCADMISSHHPVDKTSILFLLYFHHSQFTACRISRLTIVFFSDRSCWPIELRFVSPALFLTGGLLAKDMSICSQGLGTFPPIPRCIPSYHTGTNSTLDKLGNVWQFE